MKTRISVLLLSLMCMMNLPIHTQAATSAIYISPDGNDNNDGSISSPLKTLEKAKSTVRSMKEKNSISSGGVEVILRGGEYRIDTAVQFEKMDSGTADKPIVYKGYDGEQPIITTTKTIDVSQASVVTDTSILNRLPEESRGKVVSINLKSLGITEYGTLQRKIYGRPLKSDFEIFFNDEPLNISRWPKDNYILTGEILDDSNEGIVFACDEERIARWVNAKEALLYGFWRANWGDDSLHLKSIDVDNGVISTVEPPSLGIHSDRRFYIYNLLEEIGEEGEYFLDRTKGILYFYPPGPLEDAKINYSTNTGLFIDLNEVSYISFENITFDGICGDAFSLKKGEEVHIRNCIIRNIAGRAINVEYTTNSSVTGCEISNIGNSGIMIYCGDRATLTSGNFTVADNHIYKFARYNKTYNPAIGLNTVGCYVRNNLIHDAPHVAIMFNGNDTIMEYNEIYDVLQETDDCGAIYAGRNWTVRGNVIRYNYLHDIIGPGTQSVGVYLDDTLGGTEIYGNVMRNVTMPILMGGGSDNMIENNLIVNKTKNSSTAIEADDRGLQSWYVDDYNKNVEGNELTRNLKAMPYQNAVWQEKYPLLYNILEEDPMLPKRNSIKNNIISKHIKSRIAETVKELGTVESNWETAEDLFLKVGSNGKLYFEDDTILEKFQGFEPIEFDKIGLTGNGNYTIPDTTEAEVDVSQSLKALVDVSVEPILIQDLFKDTSQWAVNKTMPSFSDNGVVFGPGVVGYTQTTYGNGALRFRIKPDSDYGWLGVCVRSSMPDKAPWEGSNGYILVIKKSALELQRWMGGTQAMVSSLSNSYILENEWSDVEFITVVVDMTTYLIIRVNNEEIITFADDDAFALKKDGYITFFNGGSADKKLSIGKADSIVDMPLTSYVEQENDDENSLPETAASDEQDVYKIILNGENLKTDSPSIEVDGRILVSSKSLFEGMGMGVNWNQRSSTIVATAENQKITMVVGDKEAVVNGKIVHMEVPVRILNGKAMVPIRFVAETLNLDIQWDDKSGTIELMSSK